MKNTENQENFKFRAIDSVSVQIHYMAYACGECYPQYRIEEVLFSEFEDPMAFFNKEIFVEFDDNKLEMFVDSCIQQCDRRFVFCGNIVGNNYGMMKMHVKKVQLEKQ